MPKTVNYLLNELKQPKKEINIIREGIPVYVVESFLEQESLPVKEILERLAIPASTYFAKKKNHKALDSYTTEKFLRLISVTTMADTILGKTKAKDWLHNPVPALGNEAPLDLLDTETGHQLVVQALLQIKYGIYG